MEQSTLPIISFPGKIHYIQNNSELNEIVKILETVSAFGFDTETRPAFKKGESYQVALLQLSTLSDAFVIRLHRVNQYDILKSIFENSEIVKVGVALRDDIKQLQKRFAFEPQNFIELQNLAKQKGLENFGLKGMTEEVLGSTITKGPKTTNWEAAELTEKQILYAATDAWIGLRLYHEMKSLDDSTISR